MLPPACSYVCGGGAGGIWLLSPACICALCAVQVVHDCLVLNRIAQALRRGRFANGALSLDNVRITFGLDANGNPVSCGQYVQRVCGAEWLEEGGRCALLELVQELCCQVI